MRDPAITAYGVSYERSAIEAVRAAPQHLPCHEEAAGQVPGPPQSSSETENPAVHPLSDPGGVEQLCRVEEAQAFQARPQGGRSGRRAAEERAACTQSRQGQAQEVAFEPRRPQAGEAYMFVPVTDKEKAAVPDKEEERVNVYEAKRSNFSIPRSPSMDIRSAAPRKNVAAGSSYGRSMLTSSTSSPTITRSQVSSPPSRCSFSASNYGNKFLSRSQELQVQAPARWYRSAGADRWRMYSNINNTALEAAYQAGSAKPVRLHGRGAEVNIGERLQQSENGTNRRVLRATWFHQTEDESAPAGDQDVLVPFEERDAAILEQCYFAGTSTTVTLSDKVHEVVFRKADDIVLVPAGKAAPESKVIRGFSHSDNHKRVVPQLGST
eukprot:CAMPEP_0114609112 /NCGR_PEP_ID=MMETSP0168-20121206/2922_1 /TAXON_ID=95228 ORGANISM="Vannella sp., Strain DIVA3 517/6/12" /NCGR_SAMPLE_ID=MMETSP0168 /ASSEMBLY_ACC=CAM_ASM_000044 /LENGTH=380 /DNA_ID=CAMNT_0001820023 /DNA_START=76 /DNA_END=1218 /DNA_ORIENTATION=+